MRLTILTSEQAALLYDLVKEHRPAIIQRWSFGIYDSLLLSLMQIDRGGGALLRNQPLDYGSGMVGAAICPPTTYIVSPSFDSVTVPFLEPVERLPDLRFQCLSWRPKFFRAKKHLAVLPLPATITPPLPLR